MVAYKSPELAIAELSIFAKGESLLPEPFTLELGNNDPDPNCIITVIPAADYSPIILASADWNSANLGRISNARNLLYPIQETDWGLIQSYRITSASRHWYAGSLTNGVTLGLGYRFQFTTFDGANLVLSLYNPNNPDNATIAGKNARLNVLKGQSVSAPSICKVHLSASPPDANGNIIDITPSGYAPAEYGIGATYWSDPAGRTTHNTLQIDFPMFLEYAGPIKGVGVSFDDMMWYSMPVSSGMIGWKYGQPYILPGKLIITA
jgi:hypothetical protein